MAKHALLGTKGPHGHREQEKRVRPVSGKYVLLRSSLNDPTFPFFFDVEQNRKAS